MTKLAPSLLAALLLSIGLSACGGGGDDRTSGIAILQSATADTGLARFNERRAQLNLPLLTRDPQLDYAAQVHSNVQAKNDTITHGGLPGHEPGWETLQGRIAGSGYPLTPPYVIGEVISRTVDTSGAYAADALIAAIYHRFVIFEPMFSTAGVGAASSATNRTYFTTNFAGLDLRAGNGIGRGNVVVYPRNGQIGVQRNFFSDQEQPDPVCTKDGAGVCTDSGLNEVGYPISIHADVANIPAGETNARNQVFVVNTFTARPQGSGTNLAVEELWTSVDPATRTRSVAAIVPLNVLLPNTTYEVQFSGLLYEQSPNGGTLVNPIAVNENWSFTTGP